MDTKQIRIRRVTKDDYDKVLDMFPPGEIYNGTDYLPDYFYMLMDVSNAEAYAAVLDDKFVSFVLFYIVDGGKTMITRASRTRKEYEGHGLFRRLLQYFETASSHKQTLLYHAATGHIDEKEVLRKIRTGQRYKVLQKVSFVLFYIVDGGKTMITRASRTRKEYEGHGLFRRLLQYFETASSHKQTLLYHAATGHIDEKEVLRKIRTGQRYKVLQKDFKTYLGTSTTELRKILNRGNDVKYSTLLSSDPELNQLLCNRSLCDSLFPEGRIMVDWVPYRLIESNTSLINMEKTTAVVSNLHNPEYALLTFVSSYRAHIGLVWNLDIYGHVSSTLREHIVLHFNNIAVKNIPEKIFIRCFCTDKTKWNLISDIMKDLELEQRLGWGVGIIISERLLNKPNKL